MNIANEKRMIHFKIPLDSDIFTEAEFITNELKGTPLIEKDPQLPLRDHITSPNDKQLQL